VHVLFAGLCTNHWGRALPFDARVPTLISSGAIGGLPLAVEGDDVRSRALPRSGQRSAGEVGGLIWLTTPEGGEAQGVNPQSDTLYRENTDNRIALRPMTD
jgi:hypothetical protein